MPERKPRSPSTLALRVRQPGKNWLQSHLFAWLLFRAAPCGGRIVSVSPTFKPRSTNKNAAELRGHFLVYCL